MFEGDFTYTYPVSSKYNICKTLPSHARVSDSPPVLPKYVPSVPQFLATRKTAMSKRSLWTAGLECPAWVCVALDGLGCPAWACVALCWLQCLLRCLDAVNLLGTQSWFSSTAKTRKCWFRQCSVLLWTELECSACCLLCLLLLSQFVRIPKCTAIKLIYSNILQNEKCLLVYTVFILPNSCCLSLSTMCMVSWVDYVNTVNEPARSGSE